MHDNKIINCQRSDKQYIDVTRYSAILIKILIYTLLCQNLLAKSGWVVQNPFPTESWLLTVEPVTNNKVFIGGLGGTLLKTTNSGQIWDVRKFNDLTNIRSISFKDSLNGWLVDSKRIYKTDNGGDSWIKVDIETDISMYSIHDIFCFNSILYLILSPLSAYVGDENDVKSVIIKSIDGGNTWQQLEQEIKGKIRCEFFLNDSVGFLGVSKIDSYFYKTNNGGKTWGKKNFPGYLGATPGIFFLDENFGFIGQYKTTDGGETWDNIFTDGDVNDIYFTDLLHGWVITDERILQTVNGGLSWEEVSQQGTHHLTDINFSPNGTGWIVGWACNIFRKESGNNNWQSFSKGTRNSLRDVYFVDEYKGWSVGENGCILHTSNGGDTWETQLSPADSTLFKVKFLNKFEGWIAGYGILLHTSDGGNNWELRSDLHWWFVDIDFFDDKNGLLIERSGAVFRTSDRGINWQLINNEPLTKQLTCVAIVNENEAWFGGWGGLGHTTDKGATIQWYNIPSLLLVTEMQFVDNNDGFLCNDFGDFLGTNDGGWTWQEFPRGQGLDDEINTFYALSANSVWLYLGLGGASIKQIVVNRTIEVTASPSFWFWQIHSVFFENKNTGWAVGDGGIILKYLESGINSVNSETIQKPLSFIYPNPFGNKGANINLSLQETQKITIEIYNSIGQKVQTIYAGIVNKGRQTYFWQPKEIATGIYFIKILGNKLNITQKCLFINR